MFSDFMKAVRQLDDRKFRMVLIKALGITAALLAAIYIAVGAIMQWIGVVTLPLIGDVNFGGWLMTGLAVGGAFWASVFLMIPVASVSIGFFLEDIADAVEEKHFPQLSLARKQHLSEVLLESLAFFGVMLGANLVALVFYLMSGPFAPLIFFALNGFLLGREYFQLVAQRRLDPKQARTLRKANFFRIWIAGILMAVPLVVPILNLIIPILGVATFTHLFHRLNAAQQETP